MKKISISVLTVLSLFVGSFYLNTVEAQGVMQTRRWNLVTRRLVNLRILKGTGPRALFKMQSNEVMWMVIRIKDSCLTSR